MAKTGKHDPRLRARCPRECEQIWLAYLDLSQAKPAGLGPSGIPFTEIEAWQRLMGVQLTPWEIETIIDLDTMATQQVAKRSSKGKR